MGEKKLTFTESMVFMLISIPISIYGGWILAYLWKWFWVPVSGMPEISIPMGMGLVLLSRFFCPTQIKNEEVGMQLFSSFFSSSILWLIAYIISFFI